VSESFRQIPPDLAAYRRELVAAGAPSPLPGVPLAPDGLLARLPAPPPGRHGWPWDVQTGPFALSTEGWPKITIVTPSFQQGDFLEETIRSVLLQNYPRLEFIVMDGGSRDASPAIIERYRPWLSYARCATDRGQAHAINLGFSLAGGDVRGWLNSDDFFLPGALRRVARIRAQGAEFIYGDGIELDQATGCHRYATVNLASKRYRKFPGLVLQPSSFWAATCDQPLWEAQQCAVDYELWIRLLPGRQVHYINWPLAVARQHEAAKTYDPAMKKRWDEDAFRNGEAHPELYGPSPWLDLEYSQVQRFVRRWRQRGMPKRCAALRRDCAWAWPVIPTR
jgi:hypothetical protein